MSRGARAAEVAIWSVCVFAVPTAGHAQRYDLRVDPDLDTAGPLRDPSERASDDEDDEAPPDALDDEEAPMETEPLPPPEVLPPAPRRPSRAQANDPFPPPTTRFRGERAPRLFAEIGGGPRIWFAIGGHLGPRLALSLDAAVFAFAWTLGRDARASSVLESGYYAGLMLDYYPGRGQFHLRGSVGGAVGFFDTRIQVDAVVMHGEYVAPMPAMNLGVGYQWRPMGTFGRFRLGLLLHSGMSTFSHAGDRMYLIDLGLSTTVTWF